MYCVDDWELYRLHRSAMWSVKEGDSDSDQQDEYSSQDDSLLNNYMCMKTEPLSSNDPLHFWRMKETVFPHVAVDCPCQQRQYLVNVFLAQEEF